MKTQLFAIMLVLGFAGMASATLVDSNSVFQDGIEYYIQTNKSIYNLGENVEILYRITNLTGNPVDIGMVLDCEYAYYNFIVTQDDNNEVWQYLRIVPPCNLTTFHLDPHEAREFQTTWDMVNDNGTFSQDDDFSVGLGSYNVIGELRLYSGPYERVPVSVSVEIIPEPAVQAMVDLDPDVFEVKVGAHKKPKKPRKPKGEFLRAFIELPADVNVADVNVATVNLCLNDTILATAESPLIVDNILDVLFRLDLDNVGTILGLEVTKVKVDDCKIKVKAAAAPSQPIDLIELTVSGELTDGTRFQGTDTIRVIDKGRLRGGLVNSNSIVQDGIEYYIQTNKSVYDLGEDVEILYRITNLTDQEWGVSGVGSLRFILVSPKGTEWFDPIWDWVEPAPPGPTGLTLQPNGSVEVSAVWPQIDTHGTPHEPGDDTQVPPGIYTITARLRPTDTNVAVDVTIAY